MTDSPVITREDWGGDPVICVHIPGGVLVMTQTAYNRAERITRDDWDGMKIVGVHVPNDILVMTELDYDKAITRGKQWKSWKANDKRMRQRQAEDEAAQLDWMDR